MLSLNSLTLCLRALEREKLRLEQMLSSGKLTESEQDDAGQEVLDLQKAISELCPIYEDKRKKHKGLQPAEEILGSVKL